MVSVAKDNSKLLELARQVAQKPLETLTAAEKRAVVSEVSHLSRTPPVEVAEALVAVWSKANESRGLRFQQYQGGAGAGLQSFRPMASVHGMSPIAMQIAQKQLANVGTFQEVASDTRANQLANEAFKIDKAGQHLGAIAMYQEALNLEPADPMIRNRLGLAIKHLGSQHFNAALEAIGSALAIDPSYPPAHYNAACIFALKGDEQRAALHFAHALKAKPEFFEDLASKDKDFARIGGAQSLIAAARRVMSQIE